MYPPIALNTYVQLTSGKGRRILFYVRGYRFVLDLVLGKPGFAVNEGLWFVSLLTLFFAPYTKKPKSGAIGLL